MHCVNCGKLISNQAETCVGCGHPVVKEKVVKGVTGKSKGVFVVLALLLGGLGIHRFYLEDWFLGFLMLAFCWTGIPMIVALFDIIVVGFRKDDPRFA